MQYDDRRSLGREPAGNQWKSGKLARSGKLKVGQSVDRVLLYDIRAETRNAKKMGRRVLLRRD